MRVIPLSSQMDWRNVPGRGDVPRPNEDRDSAIDEIADRIWEDDAVLLAAIRAADYRTPITAAVNQHAAFLYRTKHQTEAP